MSLSSLEQMNPSRDRFTPLAFLGFVILAGSNVVAIRFSNAELPPFWGAALRLSLAALFFLLIILTRGVDFPRGRALVAGLIYGVLGFGVYFAFGYYALVSTKAGLASVVLALVPLATIFLATAQGQERLTKRGLVGAALALGGTGLVFNEQLSLGIGILPLLALLGATLSYAETNVVLKHFPRSNPYSTNAVAMITGAAILFGLSAVAGERWALPARASTLEAFVFLVVPGSVVLFLLYLHVIARWSASATSYGFVLFPLVTIVVASLLAAEQVTLVFVIGSALVLIGVYAGALSRMRRGVRP